MKIFTGKEIYANVDIALKGSTGMYIMTSRHQFVSVDELIARIETICNHGDKRDMRFRKYLLKDLGETKQ